VGMSLDLHVVAASWRIILFYVFLYMVAKALVIYAVARLFRSSHREATDRAVFMAQGGEFAFVLYAAASAAGIIDAEQNAQLTAIIILSMVLTPIAIAAMNAIRTRLRPSTDGYERPDGLNGAALVIGFGRVGQIASQFLFERGYEISIIDTDVEMIDTARSLDFKVYYGDGTRLDILEAAGAGRAGVVLVCVDKAEEGTRITELVKAEFPLVPVLVRAVDRRHSIDLIKAGADLEVRETFESAFLLGQAALTRLGVDRAEIDEIAQRLRERDRERLQMEITGGMFAGRALFSGKRKAADNGES